MDIGSTVEQITNFDSQDSQNGSDIKPELMETSTNNGTEGITNNQGNTVKYF